MESYWAVSSYCASGSGGSRDKKGGGCGGGGKRWGGGKGVKLSTDAQSVAARERRHRISERFRILQSLVPGGSKMDTVSMLEEAIHYVKFLQAQIWLHQTIINNATANIGTNNSTSSNSDSDPSNSFLLTTPSSAPSQQFINNMVGHHEEAQARAFANPPPPPPPAAAAASQFEDYDMPVDAVLLNSYFYFD